MLYIFHVDTGTTITFDIKLALQSVAQLKEAIERDCGVVAAQQVLLMSGGESLEPNARVCSYSAGTDTNPIYLFSKSAIESPLPPTPSIDYGSADVDLHSQIENSLSMPAAYQTLVSRANLAQQCCALAREQTKICERLVHDQHLQQQGWAAVVANLEDITQMFQSRADQFQHSFALYLAERQQHMELLDNFSTDLGTLAKIPILPALRVHAEGFLNPDDQPSESSEPALSEGTEEVLSLLRWISAKDNQSSLEQVADQCSRGLEQFDERVMQSLKAEVNAAIDNANKQDMKEIKGLGERLFALEQLMVQTKRLVHEQSELAQGFVQNRDRASNLGDASVLPDLCNSHRRQLLVMLQNHNHVRDIRRRCTKAKEELSVNIYHRLKWIMYVENKMMEVDSKLVMYNESLKRLRRHLEVLQQIHLAPQMYMSAVAEVVRRRTFSQAFLVWASNLACQLLTVHSEELARRREFQNKFDGHFLNTLFPGLEDTPPPFATQAPSVFDNGLPKLTADDMESLRSQLPDLARSISTPDLNGITQFFLSKSLIEGSTDGNKDKNATSVGTNIPVKEQERTRAPLLSDRGGFESETDTEEFEKIGQAGVAEATKPSVFDGAKQKRQKQLEENLGNTREEVERLRSILKTMKAVMSEALSSVRHELTILREQSDEDKSNLAEMTERVRVALSLYSRECDRRLQEREQELMVDHELELAEIKKVMQNREEEIDTIKRNLMEKETELAEHERLAATMRQKLEDEQIELGNLQTRLHQRLENELEQARIEKEEAVKKVTDDRFLEIASLTNSLTQCQKRIEELEEDLATAHSDQERMVKEATDKFQLEYKTELETLRGRFKLMAASTMERSPSDCSLEKIERTDVIELANHEAILAQAKEDMKLENAAALRTAIEKERADCMTKLDNELRVATQMVEEKDRELKMCRRREAALAEECQRYKNTIRRLTKSESVQRQTLMNEKVENLEADKVWLENKIAAEKKMRAMLEQSDSVAYSEPAVVHKDYNYERLDSSQSELEEVLKGAESDKYEVEVSESKKVRLEADDDELVRLSRRLEILENDNKRLSAELVTIHQSKMAAEAKMESLMTDKVRLEIELVKERTKRIFGVEALPSESRDKEMNASVAVVSESSSGSSRDAATSPEPSRRSSSKSCFHSSQMRKKIEEGMAKIAQLGVVTVTSCNPGDVVLVFWDPAHGNYAVYQESSTLYFLHSDYVDTLDVRMNSNGSRKCVLAEVIDKEYCHARKRENRYHVPLGTKFYRVRVKPVADDTGSLAKSQLP
ncbi:PREDICTED: RB1-inducible coiled-coil protein 1 isoform X3 [Dinoponera quadriceps]|uniref:RB1-inducible coiled-coil protein 1 n=1 Tax=Dinoponera quadriceps TaxID=609295 RepID=A0A6P3XLG1_DINQU|nr:PREDICTED: RB1-inducible coiled-coil protein 1 isoform X3 [Dinoponera quadriceps]